jgi:hypothetical protein
MRSKWILVEWRSYHTAKDFDAEKDAKTQAFQIAHDLGLSKKPPLLKTLICLGFFQDHSMKRFGFMFELPSNANVARGPITFDQYIHGVVKFDYIKVPLPTFAERIELAKSLAYSVAELHTAGILHKNLHSGNILLFPSRFENVISPLTPFISGFEASRPDQNEQLSISPLRGEFEIYTHPNLRDSSIEVQGRPDFERRYDIYSLGMILLEIGVWKSLKSLYRPSLSPRQNATWLAKVAQENLPHQMGLKYYQVVLDCIDCDSARLSSISERTTLSSQTQNTNEDERGGVSLKIFIQRVISKLEKCHCGNNE